MTEQMLLIYTSADFAHALGIQVKSLRRGISRGSYPEPDGHLGRTPYWYYNTVVDEVEKRKS